MSKATRWTVLGAPLVVAVFGSSWAATTADSDRLQEVLVTATKRETSLQTTPIAITALTEDQLKDTGFFSVDDLRKGSVQLVQIQTLPINPATLQLTIRGIGNLDVSEMTRESPVAVYVDGVYLARAQGLAMDLSDLERVEVLRGPQGTIFGRNAVGGAISFISKKPTGEFDLSQQLSVGNFGLFRSITHLNLPEVAGISAKVDFFYYTRGGLVDNPAPDSQPEHHDFSELEKEGGKISLRWRPHDKWTVDYAYDVSFLKNTTDYGVFVTDPGNQVGGPESGRISTARLATPFMEPGEVVPQGHALTIDWNANAQADTKLIAAYRKLSQHDRTNFAEAFGVGWFSPAEGNAINQDQKTVELNLTGTTPDSSVEYTGGLFYFKENTEEHYVGNGYLIPDFTNAFPGLHLGNTIFVSSQALLGLPSYVSQFVNGYTVGLTGDPALYNPNISDARHIISDALSTAAYAQATWTPAAFDKRLHLTGGVRETKDKKSGTRPTFNGVATSDAFDLDQSHFDYAATVAWDWSIATHTYLRYSTAYQGGGANIRSVSFAPYDPEVAKSWELGLKSEFFDDRARLNIALYDVEYQHMQLDFLTPQVTTETINATYAARVKGVELEFAAHLTNDLQVNLNYNYTDGNLPLQPNPTAPGSPLTHFFLPETPKHSGTLSATYTAGRWDIGELNIYGELTARSDLYLATLADPEPTGGYFLVNGRISLSSIPIGGRAKLEFGLWGYNLTNRLYNAAQFSGPPTEIMAQNEARTYGLDVLLHY
jgi:iron complex outermembrane recepter protein